MFSVVIPVFNESDSLTALHAEFDQVARANAYELDLVFVDDGSTDASWQTICELARRDPRVRGLRFRRNFGKAAALAAGFDAARGTLVFTLDADLQDDPAELPRFLAEIDRGLDVVSGWKAVRHDPLHKVWPSRVFNWLVSRLTGVKLHDHNCGFKCYRREIFREVRLYGELHRFVPVLAAARGWKVGEIQVKHRARKFGQSKYGVRRFTKGFLDLLTVKFLTGFGQRPQHLLGTVGLISFLAGAAAIAGLSIWWVVSRVGPGVQPIHLHQRALFYYAIGALLLGAQFISVGVVAELITAHHNRTTDFFSISERVGSDGAAPTPPAPTRRDGDTT